MTGRNPLLYRSDEPDTTWQEQDKIPTFSIMVNSSSPFRDIKCRTKRLSGRLTHLSKGMVKITLHWLVVPAKTRHHSIWWDVKQEIRGMGFLSLPENRLLSSSLSQRTGSSFSHALKGSLSFLETTHWKLIYLWSNTYKGTLKIHVLWNSFWIFYIYFYVNEY